jgi:hypothetical protein
MEQTAPPAAAHEPAGFDLDTIEDVGSAEYEITHPVTGAGTGAFITLAGPEHPERKRITMSLIRRMRADSMRQKAKASDPEDDLAESRQMLVKVTLGWRGMRKNGRDLPFSAQAATELYADPKTQWLTQQLLAAMNDRELFIKA